MNIKEIVLEAGHSTVPAYWLSDEKPIACSTSNFEKLISFAEALIAELAKQNKPVAEVLSLFPGEPDSYINARAIGVDPFNTWTFPQPGTKLYTIPPTAEQIAAEQLNNKMLREALEFLNARIVTMDLGGVVERALSTPASTEALDKHVAEKVNKIESCRDWYKRRIDLLQEWQSKMRDPERTIVCDIIANGLTMPEGGRYEIDKSDLSTLTDAATPQ